MKSYIQFSLKTSPVERRNPSPLPGAGTGRGRGRARARPEAETQEAWTAEGEEPKDAGRPAMRQGARGDLHSHVRPGSGSPPHHTIGTAAPYNVSSDEIYFAIVSLASSHL